MFKVPHIIEPIDSFKWYNILLLQVTMLFPCIHLSVTSASSVRIQKPTSVRRLGRKKQKYQIMISI